jgi:hypothetical protein
MSFRRWPRIGDRVTVLDVAAETRGVVAEFDEDRGRVLVLTDDGDVVAFLLNGATGRFHVNGQSHGARLVFDLD